MKEHTIWSNIDIKLEDWKDYLDDYKENNLDEDENFDEDLQYELVTDLNNDYLDDERMNLNVQLNNPILVIGDLGLWNGRVSAYKIINSGNIKDILYDDADYIRWYSDGYNIKCKAIHHDGTNYYEYREIKNIDNIHNLTEKLLNQEEVSRDMINQYTKSILPYVKKVYGW